MIDTDDQTEAPATGNVQIGPAALSVRVSRWSAPAGGAPAGGDWCDVLAIDKDIVGITIGDVAGHGEAAAETMELLRRSIVTSMWNAGVPSDVLSAANDVAASLYGGVVVTAIVAFLDHRLGTLTFANAGHPPPLLFTPTEHAYVSQASADFPLGIFPLYRAADYVIALPDDALLVLYTDGITEHNRDPLAGEIELVAATRLAYGRRHRNDARSIAGEVLRAGRGCDDAAAIVLRIGSALRPMSAAAPARSRRIASSRPNFA